MAIVQRNTQQKTSNKRTGIDPKVERATQRTVNSQGWLGHMTHGGLGQRDREQLYIVLCTAGVSAVARDNDRNRSLVRDGMVQNVRSETGRQHTVSESELCKSTVSTPHSVHNYIITITLGCRSDLVLSEDATAFFCSWRGDHSAMSVLDEVSVGNDFAHALFEVA